MSDRKIRRSAIKSREDCHLYAHPGIFYACHLVQPSERGEYELSDAIDLLLDSGQTIDTIPLDGWRIDVAYLKDRDRAEELLDDSGGYAELCAIQSRG